MLGKYYGRLSICVGCEELESDLELTLDAMPGHAVSAGVGATTSYLGSWFAGEAATPEFCDPVAGDFERCQWREEWSCGLRDDILTLE